ncbi:hypothetical protein CFIO01_07970 [Colletotrichum fioriniae PJ7]|uniref:Uncharacterized protein n=1 Tax=Colletotrichum fioriniae PJ7 TaxID=1445577 RepID=A0A010QH93_9PEZI|nr:hypothetical protein CFIO01_07970 [Colletotrichum fioriniae PJ7]
MAKQKSTPVASPAAGAQVDEASQTSQTPQQAQVVATSPAERILALLMPPPWARRLIFVALIFYITPFLLTHWIETSAKLIRMIRTLTGQR